MADNDNDVQALPNSTIFNGILKVRKDVNSPWQSIPAIKGASTSIQITAYSGTDTTGKTITIINNYDTEAATSTSFNILNGTGAVNSVDGEPPAENSTNVVLSAVRYGIKQELSPEQKNQALTNIGAVPITRTINGQALSSDITLTANNVNAVPTTRTINNKELSSNITLTATDISAVPTTRTINDKPLSSNITLNADDIGALSAVSQIHITKPGVSIPSSAWALTNTYNDYPYRGTISIPDVTPAMIPNVIFSWEQIESGNFSPIVATDTGAVYIYAESQPTDTVTIPAVICFI